MTPDPQRERGVVDPLGCRQRPQTDDLVLRESTEPGDESPDRGVQGGESFVVPGGAGGGDPIPQL